MAFETDSKSSSAPSELFDLELPTLTAEACRGRQTYPCRWLPASPLVFWQIASF